MATNEEKEAILTKPDDVEAGILKWRGVQVENVGKPTNLPGNLYGDTNFYIRSSARYVGDRKLSTYIRLLLLHAVYLLRGISCKLFVSPQFCSSCLHDCHKCGVFTFLFTTFVCKH